MDLIRCPRCAKEIPDLSRFCRRCGCAVGWGLSAGFSPAWPRLADVDWASERPVTLAGATKAATPATLSRPRAGCGVRAAATDRKKGGGNGAWVASLMMGLAAFMFFSHVHRMATRPVKWEQPATVVPGLRGFPADPAGAQFSPPPTPVPRSYPRPLSSDAMDWRVFPPVVTPPPPPPEVRMTPPPTLDRSRIQELERARSRAYRGWDGREEGDGVDEGPRLRGR